MQLVGQLTLPEGEEPVSSQHPELVRVEPSGIVKDPRQVAEDPVHDVGVDAEGCGLGVDDVPDALDLRGQWTVGDHSHLFADVLEQRTSRHVVGADHHDHVLPVRHEHQSVCQQAPRDRQQIGVE